MRFVFIHHLVGGLGRDVRGGAKPAAYMEWGGKNADGSEGFAQHRPGWVMPGRLTGTVVFGEALLARRDAIVKVFDGRIAERGEAAILYTLAN